MSDLVEREGACHCGIVRFTVKLSALEPRRCNCSYCRMRGAVVVSARREDLKVTNGHDHLRTYRFNTGVAEHHFCGLCGIYTHHRRRSKPDEFGVNVSCLGLSPFDFACVPVNEGVVHPNDRPKDASSSDIAGYLYFDKTPRGHLS